MRFALVVALAGYVALGEAGLTGSLDIAGLPVPLSVLPLSPIGMKARNSEPKSESNAGGNKFGNTTEIAGNTTRIATSSKASLGPQSGALSNFKLRGCETSMNAMSKYTLVAVNDDMSNDQCARLCGENRSLFATSEKHCYCADSAKEDFEAVSPESCDTPCPGNASQTCGGKPPSTSSASSNMGNMDAVMPERLSVYVQKQRVDTVDNTNNVDNVDNTNAVANTNAMANDNANANANTMATGNANANANANAVPDSSEGIVTITNVTRVMPLASNGNATGTNRVSHSRPPAPTACSGPGCNSIPSSISSGSVVVSRVQAGSFAFVGLLSLFLQVLL